MRWLIRVFASAIARRVAYVLVALCVAAMGIGNARAQAYENCHSNQQLANCPDEGEAMAGAMKAAAAYTSVPANNRVACPVIFYRTGAVWNARVNVRPPTAGSCTGTSTPYFNRSYPSGATCEKRPDYNGASPISSHKPKQGSLSCFIGCEVMWNNNADGSLNGTTMGPTCEGKDYDSDNDCASKGGAGTTYYYNAITGTCEPPEPTCPDGSKPNSLNQCAPEPCPAGMLMQADGTCKKKENECPAGNVRSPDGKCLPGEGQCGQGEARGKDGTCKRDADGDGTPDEEQEDGDPEDPDNPDKKEPSQFSGGDDCSVAPSCSGDAIMCGQARIQWRIDCNTRKNRNIAGGSCNAVPICTGEKCDALEYTQLLMQWRSACALEKLSNSAPGGGDGADLAAIRDAITGTSGNPNPGESLPGSGAWAGGGQGTDPVQPDVGGYGWGGTCPQPPSIDLMGRTIQINITPLCSWLSLGSFFVMGLAALGSLRIVAGREA